MTLQPPRNYTTTIPAARTLGEIMAMLADAGAEQIVTKYGPDRQPAGIAFAIRTTAGPAGYRLEIDAGRILARMDAWYFNGHTKAGKPTKEQAQRVAWRTLQDWLEAQVELIRNGLAPLDQVMLPWRVVDVGGTTMYEALVARQFALPPGGRGPMKRTTGPCVHQWSAIGNASYLRVLCHRCGLACRMDRRRTLLGEIQVVTALEQRNPARTARVDAPEFVAFTGDTLAAITAVHQVPAVRRFLAGSTNPLPLPGFDEEVRR